MQQENPYVIIETFHQPSVNHLVAAFVAGRGLAAPHDAAGGIPKKEGGEYK